MQKEKEDISFIENHLFITDHQQYDIVIEQPGMLLSRK